MPFQPNQDLVAAIRNSRLDPDFQATLLATSLAESGGRLDAVGDQGSSFGPYQMNRRGRLASTGFTPQQAMDPVLSTRAAAGEFQRYRTSDPGVWAARAQRPADPVGYAAKVRQLLPEARRILGSSAGAPIATATAAPAAASTVRAGFDPSTMNRIAAYLAKSEKAVLSGAEVPDIMPLLSKLRFRQTTLPQVQVRQPASLPLVAGDSPGYGWADELGKNFGVQVSSTYRDPEHNRRVGGSPTSAHMRRGAAADFSGSPEAMRRLAEWAISSGRAKEVFYDPLGYYWDNGKIAKGSIGGHSDHVHITWR